MLTTVNTQLRRHRRKVRWALAVLVVALVAVTAHSALMSGPLGDHAMSDAGALCMVVGGALAAAGVAAFSVRRLPQRPTRLIALPIAALPFVRARAGLLARAGPPPLTPVLRL